MRRKPPGRLEDLDRSSDVLGVELGARDPPWREVGHLIGVDHISTDQRHQSVVPNAEVVTCLLTGLVGRLEDENLVIRDDAGATRPRDPSLLLDAWQEEYGFEKHRILRGHVAARSGDTLLRSLAETLRVYELDHAASGLGAAWLITRFAGFRLVTVYLREQPPVALLEGLPFREEARGANVWLVIPNDEGVFHGA